MSSCCSAIPSTSAHSRHSPPRPRSPRSSSTPPRAAGSWRASRTARCGASWGAPVGRAFPPEAGRGHRLDHRLRDRGRGRSTTAGLRRGAARRAGWALAAGSLQRRHDPSPAQPPGQSPAQHGLPPDRAHPGAHLSPRADVSAPPSGRSAHEDRAPTRAELERMRGLVDDARRDGALGLGSALIYSPATYADTDELVALAEVVARYGGMYISHLRSEGGRLIEAIEELIEIARRGGLRAEIYHLKQAGRGNWTKLDAALATIERARAAGLAITADMYPYEAGATGLSSCFPPWVHEGGLRALLGRLRDDAQRARIREEMARPGVDWENLYLEAGSPDGILLQSFKSERLKPLTGKRLAEVAREREGDPRDVAMDLVVEDESRVGAIYFMISPDNLRHEIARPWMSFGSDAGSLAPEGVFLRSQPHPRAYGTFARVLGRFVREEGTLTLADAIRRLTSLPASNLKLDRRGALRPGFFADVAVFDPARIQDHATYAEPHRYATGMLHVLVNGVPVLRDGEHTDARPGRVLFGPGRR